jgi:P-type E1-E2 ATPase
MARADSQGRGRRDRRHVEAKGGGHFPAVRHAVDDVARRAARRWWWRRQACAGRVELKDIVKGGIKERFAELRRMGIKTVMITGDNR